MDRFLRFRSRDAGCSHLAEARVIESSASECPDCIAEGTSWIHLRMCLICGKVGCCNSSERKHAQGHHDQTGHRLVRTLEPWEDWAWCFEDEVFIKPRALRRAAQS